MELNLERPLLFFDIESTGLLIASDGIIELSFVKVLPGGENRIKTWKIKPWDYVLGKQIHISEEASKVNGVYDKDLVDCPRFIEVLPEVLTWLEGSDLAGFNSAKFDLPMLAEEIERVRAYCTARLRDRAVPEDKKAKAREMLSLIEGIDLHACRMVDVQNIYHFFEPRNLKAAYRFYCGGEDFENAHTAEADTIATYEVLKGQLDRYGDQLKNDVASLSAIGGRARGIDFAGRLIYGENDEPVISFGKHKGRTAREVWEKEPAYFGWIENGDFTLDTKHQFALLKKRFEAEAKAAREAAAAADAEAMKRPASPDELAGLAEKFNGRLF
ncbi:MAG: 3'-5' exonuclease [Bacteroidales bacterium]|nr:3'-5' exonuclease [Bacteroidales bacterium]